MRAQRPQAYVQSCTFMFMFISGAFQYVNWQMTTSDCQRLTVPLRKLLQLRLHCGSTPIRLQFYRATATYVTIVQALRPK